MSGVSGSSWPVSSANSRRPTATSSSPASTSPLGIVQCPRSLSTHCGPPMCPSSTSRRSFRRRQSRMPALVRPDLSIGTATSLVARVRSNRLIRRRARCGAPWLEDGIDRLRHRQGPAPGRPPGSGGPVNATAALRRVRVSMEHPVTAATRGEGLRRRSTEGHRAQARHGEGLDSGFVAFARRRGPHHLRTAVLLTGDWHTAEDLVQTCLVKLYQVWHRLDTGVDPDAYLRRMLVNTQRSWWRTRWRQEAPVEVVPDRAAIGGDGQEQHALADTVRGALAALPARQRAALVLRYFEDLPEAHVADLLGCSVGTVKTHTSRGIRRLRELLGDELVPDGLDRVNVLAGQRRDST